ncbi:MAG: anaerobic C4-dicarboxylate transporter [Planctomycetes bacterium]|nr:anaerobic C4-dicarboxylate transporter [Planctomycetota bacterium]
MLALELLTVLAAILLGARLGGVAMGNAAMLGVAVLVFAFGLPPSGPPGTVLAIVLSVVTAAATLQAAGGMELLVGLAEKALRARPRWITFLGPAVAYLFTFCSGTGHVAYAILPVIAEVARKAGIRPERPMAISVIASQQAITASPLSAATAGLLAILASSSLAIGGSPIELWHILAIAIPSTFLGCMLGAFVMCFVGRELADDPEFQRRLAAGLAEGSAPAQELAPEQRASARRAVLLFVAASLAIVVFGLVESLRPRTSELARPASSISASELERAVEGLREEERRQESITREELAARLETLSARPAELREVGVPMATLIQIVMYCAAALIVLICRVDPARIVATPVATAGLVAVISILGLGWLGNCFFDGNSSAIVGALSDTIREMPWVFALGLFGLSVLLFSQASTVAALMPLGIALGLPATTLIAFFPAVNGYFLLPTYGTIVAAVAFDSTGTTRIGRYVLNHSFQLPGLVSTIAAIGIGFALASLFFG